MNIKLHQTKAPEEINAYLKYVDYAWEHNIKIPVTKIEDLKRLDEGEIMAGYLAYDGDLPEPGKEKTRAFWHGWRNKKADLEGPNDDQRALAKAYVKDILGKE